MGMFDFKSAAHTHPDTRAPFYLWLLNQIREQQTIF